MRVGVVALPWLCDRIEVEDAKLVAEFDKIGRGRIHRKVEEKIAASDALCNLFLIICFGERAHFMPYSVCTGRLKAPLVGRDDGKLRGLYIKMLKNEWQNSLAD